MVKKTVKSASASTDKAVRKASGAPAVNIGISEKDRAAIASGLSHLLADTYTLYLTTHNFHWNVTGPLFNSLHDMFMAQYTELWNAVDPIAERIRSLAVVTAVFTESTRTWLASECLSSIGSLLRSL